MDLKLSQEIKLVQKLSPLQIQTIKLIELPIQELQQRIRKELEENPVLDEDNRSKDEDDRTQEPSEVSLSDYSEDDSIPRYKLYVNNSGKDELPQYNTFSVKESFNDSLLEQLGYKDLDEHSRAVASFIIGSIGNDGYLRRDTDSIVDDIEFRTGMTTSAEEVEKMIALIQSFEPAGVGARDLRECLLLQLKRCRQDEATVNATMILRDHFADFASKHFDKIMQHTLLSSSQLKASIGRILKLNPTPGGQIDDLYTEQAQQIVPDFHLDYIDGEFQLTMPRFNIPELKINRKYAAILEEAEGSNDRSKKEAAMFVKQKLDSAKWLIEAVKQRHTTLMKTMQAILDFQKEYFTDGDEAKLKPMVLKDIAENTGYDISTVSRVANSKYIETHFGVFPLKYFFSEGMKNSQGEEVSTKGLKKALEECISREDKHNPLTDDQIVGRMAEMGYKLARRTVVKYRDQLGIPQARMRKEI